MKTHTVVAMIGAGTAAIVIGCGGGGGGGTSSTASTGTIPPAQPPTCNSSVVMPDRIQVTPGGGDPRVWVPPSSEVRPQDAGIRAHTNHLILMRSMVTRDPSPSGYSPTDIRSAYNLPSSGGSGAIAIVDAYDDPNALSDFNFFSTFYRLPTESSSVPTASGNSVFQVVYATGTEPAVKGDWAEEISLDTQWAHAIAPGAKIYLVEAASANTSDLFTAVQVAKALPGVTQVSMSFGIQETSCDYVNYDSFLVRAGVTFFAAAGDTPGERDFPAESVNATDVGGTHLTLGPLGQYGGETAWNGGGCGLSSYEPRPTFQNGIDTIVRGYRGGVDISADADPNTGVNVYDSLSYNGAVGWLTIGGTSAATPIIAGIANLSGTNRASSQAQNAAFYGNLGSGNFHDITAGAIGNLKAGPGWDYPTGVGTPVGLGGF